MMGRGTRLAKDIQKTHFTVFDAVGVIDYFKNATVFDKTYVPSKPIRSYKEIISEINNKKNRDYNTKILIKRFHRIANNISAEGRKQLEQLHLSYKVLAGKPANEIIKFSEESDIDLIVMASSRISSTIRVIGSTVRKVIDSTSKPVLVIHE